MCPAGSFPLFLHFTFVQKTRTPCFLQFWSFLQRNPIFQTGEVTDLGKKKLSLAAKGCMTSSGVASGASGFSSCSTVEAMSILMCNKMIIKTTAKKQHAAGPAKRISLWPCKSIALLLISGSQPSRKVSLPLYHSTKVPPIPVGDLPVDTGIP